MNHGVEEVMMLIFCNGLVHFHIHKMHSRSFGTGDQCLILVGQETDIINRVVDDSFYLSDRHLALGHRVDSYAAIGMS